MEQENNCPTPEQARELLAWAAAKNPGKWVDHSETTARAAKVIASHAGLDQDKAYVLGLLHDIGRYDGVRALYHVQAGYALMNHIGYSQVAQVCLSHSFPVKDIALFSGKNDCTPEETAGLQKALAQAEYTIYDELVQLCDSLCLPEGVCLMEVRLMDVVRRHGLNPRSLEKWNVFFSLKEKFDALCGENIYTYFYDEVVANSLA